MSGGVAGPVDEALDRAHREQWALVLASTVRLVGDLDVAEECVQDAFLSALRVWGERGIPDNPGAWLNTTARRRAIDLIRRERTRAASSRCSSSPPRRTTTRRAPRRTP